MVKKLHRYKHQTIGKLQISSSQAPENLQTPSPKPNRHPASACEPAYRRPGKANQKSAWFAFARRCSELLAFPTRADLARHSGGAPVLDPAQRRSVEASLPSHSPAECYAENTPALRCDLAGFRCDFRATLPRPCGTIQRRRGREIGKLTTGANQTNDAFFGDSLVATRLYKPIQGYTRLFGVF
jgi:hypothetical protein